MIHELDPTVAAIIGIGYLIFVITYQVNVSYEGRRSRAGKAMNYLQAVVALCSITSYFIQFLPHRLMFLREYEGYLLAIAVLGLVASGCGVRLARAMDYEHLLREQSKDDTE